MEKQVYQRAETVGVYKESHYIEDSKKTEIAKDILSLLPTHNGGKLRILDAGIGGGRLILLPFLAAAIEKHISLEIIGIDNSEPMIDDLKYSLEQKYMDRVTFNDTTNSLWLSAKVGDSSITVYNYDLENYKSILNLGFQFDAIISILTLHHLKNWRLALYSLTRTLKKDGLLIFFEWTKGIKLRDGNFVDPTGQKDSFEEINEQIVNFWKSFYEERYKYHPWVPEIMASDYSKVNNVLKEPFFVPVKKSDGGKFEYVWSERNEVSWETLKSWIGKRAYSNFHRGLSEKEHEELLKYVKKYFKEKKIDNKASTGENLGCRLRIFKKQCDLDNFESSLILDNIIDSSLSEKLIYEKIYKNNKGKRHSNLLDLATLLIQHDAITNNTSFFTINLWDILINDWRKGDKPLVFNKGFFNDEDEFHKHVASVLLYYAIIEKFEDKELISGTKFIFRELLEKPVVTIHKTADQKISRFFIRNLRTKTVRILLPESLLDTGDKHLKELINTAKGEVKKLLNGAWKPLKEDIWNLIFDNEEVTNLELVRK